jgi:hypothetical protein
VTQSVRDAFPVDVRVFDGLGTELKTSTAVDDAAGRLSLDATR